MKILIVSPTPTHPVNAGNRSRILAFSNCLRSEGHDVHLGFIGMENGDNESMKAHFNGKFHFVPYKLPNSRRNIFSLVWRKLFGALGIESAFRWDVDSWYDPATSESIHKLHQNEKFDAVMVEYVFMSKVLDIFDKRILKIIDTHDVFGDRHKNYLNAGQKPEWFSTSIEQEFSGLSRADFVIGIQENESEYFRSRMPGKTKVISVGHLISTDHACFNASSFSAVFLGSSNKINVDAAQYFISEVLPLINKAYPEFKLILGGAVCDKVADDDAIVKLGRLDSIDELYSKGLIAVNPVQMGTGLNIKTIESLSFGMPLVTTESGSRGLEKYRGSAFLSVANDDPREMAKVIIDLISNKERLAELSVSACKCIKEINNVQLGVLRTVFEQHKDLAKT